MCFVGMTSAGTAMKSNPKRRLHQSVCLKLRGQRPRGKRKEIFVAENENKDLNKPNQNQTGNSNSQNGQNGNRAPRKPRAKAQTAEQAADKPQEAAKPRRPRMPRKPASQQTAAPTTGGDKPQAAQPPRAPRANHRARTAKPQAAAAAANAGSANTAAPLQAATPAQPRRNPPRQRVSNNAQTEHPRSANARQAERPKTGMRRRIVAPVTLEEKPCISQTLQWVGKKPPTMRSRASEHPSRATLRMIPLGGMCEIGKNMTAYEYGNDIIIVDCGQIFPDETMPGVDAVIPPMCSKIATVCAASSSPTATRITSAACPTCCANSARRSTAAA